MCPNLFISFTPFSHNTRRHVIGNKWSQRGRAPSSEKKKNRCACHIYTWLNRAVISTSPPLNKNHPFFTRLLSHRLLGGTLNQSMHISMTLHVNSMHQNNVGYIEGRKRQIIMLRTLLFIRRFYNGDRFLYISIRIIHDEGIFFSSAWARTKRMPLSASETLICICVFVYVSLVRSACVALLLVCVCVCMCVLGVLLFSPIVRDVAAVWGRYV